MGYVYARLIYKGKRELDDVPAKYKTATVATYLELYGINLEDSDD